MSRDFRCTELEGQCRLQPRPLKEVTPATRTSYKSSDWQFGIFLSFEYVNPASRTSAFLEDGCLLLPKPYAAHMQPYLTLLPVSPELP
jgi:hypothetical protein